MKNKTQKHKKTTWYKDGDIRMLMFLPQSASPNGNDILQEFLFSHCLVQLSMIWSLLGPLKN